MQDLVEQNARLVGQFPATMKSFNDSLERFNQTVGAWTAWSPGSRQRARQLIGPLEKLAPLRLERPRPRCSGEAAAPAAPMQMQAALRSGLAEDARRSARRDTRA